MVRSRRFERIHAPARSPDVLAFLEAFRRTTEDQLEMLPAFEIDGEDPAAVAADWVAAHEDTWSIWFE